MAEEGSNSISVKPNPGQLSEVIRKTVSGEVEVEFHGKGFRGCLQLIQEAKLKEGHIICIERSIKYHLVRDRNRKAHEMTKPEISKFLQMFGFPPNRNVAYFHFAIYVGRSDDGKFYVAENAGGFDKDQRGTIQLTEIEDSFHELEGEESGFYVVSPHHGRRKNQQHALATIHDRLVYTYHAKYFNCEAYVGICAGFYDEDAKGVIKPGHSLRVLQPDNPKEDPKGEASFNVDKQKMLHIFSERKEVIDSHKFKIVGNKVELEKKQ